MNISTELYRVFYKVAQHGSFSKAAESLFISQSAVSQSIKNLEKALGFPLLMRTTKQVSMTLDGEMLFSHLDQAFSIIKSAEDKLQMRQDKYNGQLVFAATDTLCKYFLLPKIKKSYVLYPGIKFKIINGTSLECMELLKKAAVDFALINIPENPENIFEISKKYPFHDVFIASLDFNIKKRTSLAEIAKHPILALDKKSVTRNFLDGLFLKNGIRIKPEMELQNLDLLIDMAEMGLGIAFVPDLCVKERALKTLEVEEAVRPREFGIVSLKSLPLTPAAQTFLDLL